MIDTPHITQTRAHLTALIHLTIPRSEIRSAMGSGISEVIAAAKAQGIGPAGPCFTHHLRVDPAIFDFEICVPVTAPVIPVGRVVPGEIPSIRVARTVYTGPYEGLGTAWGEFDNWIVANRHIRLPDLYECYLTGPEATANPAEWRTELSHRLTDQP